jgi:hypothetical protein
MRDVLLTRYTQFAMVNEQFCALAATESNTTGGRMKLFRVRWVWFAGLAATGALSGCSELLGLGCHAAVRVTLSPGDTTVSVGSRYTAFVLISECNEDRPANPTLTYSSQDTTVATVEPATGVVTAVAVGSTLLTATGAEFGQRYNAGTVTVR